MAEGELSVVNSGKETEFEWKIKNFSLSRDQLRCYWSPKFKFEGESWFLQLFPNGKDGYMHLCLWRSSEGLFSGMFSVFSGFMWNPIDVEFFVSVKTTNGMKNFERRERRCFKRKESGYYIEKWINRSEFSNRQGEFLSSGCLTILLTMQKAQCEKETQTDSDASICSCCKENIDADKISFHKHCLGKASKCPKCHEDVSLPNWFDHVCQMENAPGESCTSQTSGSQSKDKTAQDWKKLNFNQENCDVVLKVQGQEFSAHQRILAARSPVFASLFRSNMKETVTGKVDIEDVDPNCFSDFLRFMYCGEIENLSFDNVYSLFSAADKYDITDLRTMCLELMKEKLSDEISLRKTYLDSFQS